MKSMAAMDASQAGSGMWVGRAAAPSGRLERLQRLAILDTRAALLLSTRRGATDRSKLGMDCGALTSKKAIPEVQVGGVIKGRGRRGGAGGYGQNRPGDMWGGSR